MANDGAFLTVAATPTAEKSAVAQAPLGVSDETMTGAWRVVIARDDRSAGTTTREGGICHERYPLPNPTGTMRLSCPR